MKSIFLDCNDQLAPVWTRVIRPDDPPIDVNKAAFAHEVARTMIVDEKGTHFDPRLIESFLRCEQAFIDAATKHAEVLTPGLAA